MCNHYFRYSEEVFSQHSRRHSNDTNSDLSDGEIFLPEDNASPRNRRKSKAGEILASPTHRKITPTNIGNPASPTKRAIAKQNANDSRSSSSGGSSKAAPPHLAVDELHEFYRKKMVELKRSHEDTVRNLNYKLQSFQNRQADDEYMVSYHVCGVRLLTKKCFLFSILPLNNIECNSFRITFNECIFWH